MFPGQPSNGSPQGDGDQAVFLCGGENSEKALELFPDLRGKGSVAGIADVFVHGGKVMKGKGGNFQPAAAGIGAADGEQAAVVLILGEKGKSGSGASNSRKAM